MICTDPPYGVTACHWDKVVDIPAMWQQFNRVISKNGAMVMTATQPFATDLINSNRKMFKYELIWAKTSPVGFAIANKQPMRAHENILVFYSKQPTYNPQKMPGEPYTMVFKDKGYRENSCYRMRNVAGVSSYEGRMPTSIITVTNRGGGVE
jgi:site-specific DNA-methyltransferase (adenine-specific)